MKKKLNLNNNNMPYISVDVESDAQCPAVGSMVCFGAVLVKDTSQTFYGETRPIMESYEPEALAISGFSREQHEKFEDPKIVMIRFDNWIKKVCGNESPIFISDNNGFDWQWTNYYFWKYLGRNPFGFSCRRIGDIYCGLVKDAGKNRDWKKLYRRTKHDHNPVNDAKGNAEALIAFRDKLGLKIKF